jgi:hypothetical protein
VRATDRLHARLRKPEVLDFAFANQVLHGSRHILDRHVPVDTVLVEEIDPIGLEAFERSLGDLLDVRWPTIKTALAARFEREPELGRDDDLIAERGESFPYELFVGERAIRFSGVEECNAPLKADRISEMACGFSMGGP